MLKSTSTLSQTTTDYATPSPTSTSSVLVSEARSTRLNFPRLQSRLLVSRIRIRPHRTHALSPVRLRTKHRMSRIQGNIKIRLLPSLELMLMPKRLRT
jgi:hypothetical protein